MFVSIPKRDFIGFRQEKETTMTKKIITFQSLKGILSDLDV